MKRILFLTLLLALGMFVFVCETKGRWKKLEFDKQEVGY